MCVMSGERFKSLNDSPLKVFCYVTYVEVEVLLRIILFSPWVECLFTYMRRVRLHQKYKPVRAHMHMNTVHRADMTSRTLWLRVKWAWKACTFP